MHFWTFHETFPEKFERKSGRTKSFWAFLSVFSAPGWGTSYSSPIVLGPLGGGDLWFTINLLTTIHESRRNTLEIFNSQKKELENLSSIEFIISTITEPEQEQE